MSQRDAMGNTVIMYGAPPMDSPWPEGTGPYPMPPPPPIFVPVPVTPIATPKTLDERIAAFRADLAIERDAFLQKAKELDAMIAAIDARGKK